MNTAVATQQPSRVDVYVAEVLAPERRQRIAEALPNHLPVEKFQEAFRDAVMQTPDILKCDPREVFRSVHNVASTGLSLNPMFGEAWFVIGFSRKDGRHKPQIRVGTRGLVKLARQSGEIASVFAREVYENDVFDVDLANNEIRHEADVFGERGAIVGFYAKATLKDGTDEFEPMSLRQIEEVRDRYSDGWKAFKAGKARSTPWADSFTEMAKKTVLRRLLKRLPMSTELARALEADRDEPVAEVEQLGPPRGRPRLAAALQQAATPRPQEPPQPQPIPPQGEPEEDGDEDENDEALGGFSDNDFAQDPGRAMLGQAGQGDARRGAAKQGTDYGAAKDGDTLVEEPKP